MKTKTLTFFVAGSLALLVAVAAGLLFFIDWNQYRSTLAQLTSERLGVQVELAGELNLNLLPRPTVSANSVRLSPGQAGFSDTIATADRIDMRLGLAALLAGRFDLQSLSLDGISMTLVETPDGWQIEGWPSVEQSSDPEDAGMLLSLDRLQIKGGSIVVRRAAAPELVLEGLDLGFEGQLPSGPLDWRGSAFVSGYPVEVSGKIAPTRRPGETSARFELAAADSEIEFSGRLSGDTDVDGRFQAQGEDLGALSDFLAAIQGGGRATTVLPALPFKLDMQIGQQNGISRLVSRQANVGATRGSLDITAARNEGGYHLTGNVALGALDLDAWLNAMPEESAIVSASANDGGLAVGGALDVSIEGILLRGKQIQQVQAVVGFEEGAAFVSHLDALLPGASRLAFSIGNERQSGKIKLVSGGLPELFEWAELPLSEAVPAGRLTTADLEGILSWYDQGWDLAEITGTVDTSSVSAKMSGGFENFVPNAVRLHVDRLNLDAYWPSAKMDAAESAPSLPTLAFDLRVDALQWLGQAFENVSMQGDMSDASLSLNNISAKHGAGQLNASLRAGLAGNDFTDVAASAQLADWRYPAFRAFFAEQAQWMDDFAASQPVSGEISASGPIGALQTRLALSNSVGRVDLAGTLSREAGWSGRLQGTVAHEDIRKPARMLASGFAAVSDVAVPAELTISVSLADGQVNATANGDMGAGQFDLAAELGKNQFAADVSMSATGAASAFVDTLFEQVGIPVTSTGMRRLRGRIASRADGWSVEGLDARNGDASFSGQIVYENGQLAGALAARRLDLTTLSFDQQSGAAGAFELLGDVAIELTDISWWGQTLSAPAASVRFDGAKAQLAIGEGATMNGAPLAARFSYGSDSQELDIDINIPSFDLGRFAQAVGAAPGFAGTVSAELLLAGRLSPGRPLLNSLSGAGQFRGNAGTMNFIAVPNLIATIGNSDSTAQFLGAIGGLLREGETDFASINGAFRLDNGVALVDEVAVNGDWGALNLDGQINLPSDYLSMSGELQLARPQDAPAIPVTFEGALSAPVSSWASRALERFAIAGIERRLRSRLFGELEQAQAGQGQVQNPGAAVFQAAIGLLGALKERQEEKKRQQQEASQPDGEPVSQGSGG